MAQAAQQEGRVEDGYSRGCRRISGTQFVVVQPLTAG